MPKDYAKKKISGKRTLVTLVRVRIVKVGEVCVFDNCPKKVTRGQTLAFLNETNWIVRVTFLGPGVGELDKQSLKLAAGQMGEVKVSKDKIGTGLRKKALTLKLEWSRNSGATWETGTGGGPDMDIDDPRP